MSAKEVLMAAAGGLPIEYVGGYVEGFIGTAADVTISLTSLTGGLATAPSTDDLVIVYFATGSTADINLVVAGYTEVTELYSNDTYDTNLVVAYKYLTAADTSFVLTGGTLSISDAGAVAVQVWRNVDSVLPFDVLTTTATGNNSALANLPSITPLTEGAIIVAGGAGAHAGGTLTFTSSDLTGFITVGANDTNDVTVGLGYYEWTSGAFDPAQFGLSGADSTNNSWAAVTLALRPVYTGPVVQYQSTQSAFNSIGSSITVNKPVFLGVGDLLLAFCATSDPATTASWTPPAGWTEVADQLAAPGLMVAYKIASASEPSNYTFTMSSSTIEVIVGSILRFTNAAFDQIGSIVTDTGGNITVAGLTNVPGFSMLIGYGVCVNDITIFSWDDMTNFSYGFDVPNYVHGRSYPVYETTGDRVIGTAGVYTLAAGVLVSLKPT